MTLCFKHLQTGAPVVSNLQLYELEEGLMAAGFHGCRAYTFLLDHDPLTNRKVHSSRCTYHEYVIRDEILFLYRLAEKFFILDRKGCLHTLLCNSRDDDTGDIFDDPPQTGKSYGEVKSLVQVDVGRVEIMAACLIRTDFLAILSYCSTQSCCLLTIHSLPSFETVKTIEIRNHQIQIPEKAFMVYADVSDVEEHFVDNWLPHFRRDETNFGYLLILNCGNAICAVQLAESTSSVGFFFSWPYPAVFASFNAKIKDQSMGWSCLLLAFEDGAIVRLTAAGGQILNFASSFIKCAGYAGQAIATSNYSDSQMIPVEVGEPYIHPVKGVIAFCTLPTSSCHLLALTIFGELYLLNLTQQVDNIKRIVPEMSCFQETINNIAHLEELNHQISAQDRAINCLAIAQNCKNFKFRLDVQVVQILMKDHVFRVICQHLPGEGTVSAALNVQAQDWHIALVLARGPRRLVHVQRLSRDFKTNEPLDLMVRLSLEERYTSRNLDFDVSLIAFPNDGIYCPILPLGKVHLDVLSFVEPRTSLVLQSAPNSASRADYLADVLQSHKSDSFNKVKNREYKDWKLAMEIPTRKAPTGGVYSFEKITSKSQALWRSESWNEASCKSCWSFAVSGSKMSLDVKDQRVLELRGDNLGLVTQLKHAIFCLHNLPPPLSSVTDEKALIVAEDLLKNLEIMAFSKEEPSTADVFEIHSRKIEFLNDRFYNAVFHID
ncbi:Hypothetical protein NTJ_01070 [Nesidiocoris tenuis]|uniref:Uncharacterized protein n=1 Tax=Nesidiocoris tenuis TaxID=355587 RepID=A0ABN7A7W8_9HEMI|nr:Hypothetical protein NTJ_01070 [Nesidiocoris tenuis]